LYNERFPALIWLDTPMLLWEAEGVCTARQTTFSRRFPMKTRFFVLPALALMAASVLAAADGSWTGWISDDLCGAKNAQEGGAECTSKCVKEHGAKYVFVNDADKKVYMIDAQDKVAAHAGHHVVVKGTVDGDTLKLTSIEMAK
jgi:hypothetical protein